METVALCCACVQHAACDSSSGELPGRAAWACVRPWREGVAPVGRGAAYVVGAPRALVGFGQAAPRRRGRCGAAGRPCGAPRPGGDAAVGRWVARALLRRWEAAASTRPRRGAWVQLGLPGVVL